MVCKQINKEIKTMAVKEFKAEDLEKTPKTILEELFKHIENQRIEIEEKPIYNLNKRILVLKESVEVINESIKTADKSDLENLQEMLKSENELIIEFKNKIKEKIAETDILWANQLKIGKILGYELD